MANPAIGKIGFQPIKKPKAPPANAECAIPFPKNINLRKTINTPTIAHTIPIIIDVKNGRHTKGN